MGYRLDEIDRRIIYHLMRNARDTSAPQIADEVSVSPGTIRNRIQQMEDHGIITGFHAAIDFERTDGRLTNLYTCTADVPDREALAKRIFDISGVVNVRELMSGQGNLQVKAVGTDTNDLARISRELTDHGLQIVEESLIQNEISHPYHPFGPDEGQGRLELTDFMSLSGDAEVVEFVVDEGAPIAGRTLEEAGKEGLIETELLVISIERGDTMLTPKGETRVQPDDVITVFSRGGVSKDLLTGFTADPVEE
ncbi:winged helix-turn-helix transcriptional regulator [Halomicrococcus sp. SG-WS-1]|uniref:Lrp/AsnC family transcriptional regulator n=1 Tax=Halomicrococcus sp. SG-WS-1 TaxID=3439057 RepID=UPI003F7A7C7A